MAGGREGEESGYFKVSFDIWSVLGDAGSERGSIVSWFSFNFLEVWTGLWISFFFEFLIIINNSIEEGQ